MELKISEIANLELGKNGIWRCPGESGAAELAYPEGGNRDCMGLEENSFWFVHRNRCIVETVRNNPPAGPVFDIGGGNGYVARGLAEAGIESALVEPGEEGARNALKRGIRPVVCATLEDAGFLDRSIPAAGIFDVLEHIEQDVSFLRMLQSKLIPGGRLYLTVPAYRFLWSLEDDYASHFRRYRLGNLVRTLTGAGFRVDFATYIFWFLPLPIFVLRSLPSRLRLVREFDIDRAKNEHAQEGGLAGGITSRLLNWELERIRNGKSMACGGSCLVAASAMA